MALLSNIGRKAKTRAAAIASNTMTGAAAIASNIGRKAMIGTVAIAGLGAGIRFFS